MPVRRDPPRDASPLEDETLEGVVLGEDAPEAAARDVTPGWIGRNRQSFETARTLSRAAIPFAPPPARLALAGVSVAVDALLLAEDMRRQGLEREEFALGAVSVVLEGAAIAAMSRHAPGRLARNLAGIEAARRVLTRVRESRAPLA